MDTKPSKLLSREEFKKFVFSRDNDTCVICHKPAVDAHHIIERRLFSDGGYYIDNGASLCSACHLQAEMTNISVEEIRESCKIQNKIIPEHLYPDHRYDKWGNPILSNGTILRGELFDDPSVQTVLKAGNNFNKFSKYIKYPRTYHLPWSPGATKDDRILKNDDCFRGKQVIVTLKMDGENTSMYNDYIHARSLNDKKHWSKSWIKQFHSTISGSISENTRLIVENMYAKHSIEYTNLHSFCYGISVWNGLTCLSYQDTVEYFGVLDIPMTPTLYIGEYDREKIKDLYQSSYDGNTMEGYVIRNCESFSYKDFSKNVAKYVRPNHVTSNEHWFHGKNGQCNFLRKT